MVRQMSESQAMVKKMDGNIHIMVLFYEQCTTEGQRRSQVPRSTKRCAQQVKSRTRNAHTERDA